MSRFRNIHIGCGKLGLGLIIPVTYNCGFEVIILNREHDPSDEEKSKKNISLASTKHYTLSDLTYNLISQSPEKGNDRKIKFNEFFTFKEGSSDIDLDFNNIIEGENPVPTLITISIGKENLDRIYPLLAKIIIKHIATLGKKRKKIAPLFITACENGNRVTDVVKNEVLSRPEINKIKFFSEKPENSSVFFLNSVVDRTCPMDPVLEKDGLHMATEAYYKWFLETKRTKNIEILKNQFKKNKNVLFVNSQEFNGWEIKKYLCLNALHLSLAVLIYWYSIIDEDTKTWHMMRNVEYLAQGLYIDIIRKKIELIQEELAEAVYIYLNKSISLEEIISFNEEVIKRVKEVSDNYMRIFHNLTSIADWKKNLPKIKEKLLNHIYDAKVKDVTTANVKESFCSELKDYINHISIVPFIAKVNKRLTDPLLTLCANKTIDRKPGEFNVKNLCLLEINVKLISIIHNILTREQN